MPLQAVNMFPGGPIKSADVIQFFNLLTGGMTDQPVTLANILSVGGSQGVGSAPLKVAGVAAQTAQMVELRTLAADVQPVLKIDKTGTVGWGPGGGVGTDASIARTGVGKLLISSLDGASLTAASVPNAALATDVARANLLTNGGFEIWQRGSGPFTGNNTYAADRWFTTLVGTDAISVSRDSANADVGSQYCAACTFTLGTGAGASSIYQLLATADNPQINFARQYSFSVRIKTATANAVRISVAGNAGAWYSAYHSGSGAYETLTVTTAYVSAPTYVQVMILFAASCTAFIDNAMLVPGSVAADYAPMHPADDLARCLRYYEVLGAESAGDLNVSGLATAATNPFWQTLSFKAVKAVVPTVTKVGTWTVSNSGQPTLDVTTSKGACRATASSLAAGIVATYNGAAGNVISVEANP